ncbi:MAG: flagellar basal body-associated FliL family protein [Desulfovibrio sp.]
MFLSIVPPDSDEDFLDELDGEASKAEIDESGIADRAAQKVDLDLDDAPFLEDEDDEEEEEDEVVEAEPEPSALDDESPKRGLPAWLKNKFVLIGLLLFLLLGGGSATYFFLFADPAAPPPPVQKQAVEEETELEPLQPDTAEEILEEEPQEPDLVLVRLDPFWVEQKDKDGKIRFLILRIVLPTEDRLLASGFNREIVLVRNAVYYFLRNKNVQLVAEDRNTDELKKELLTVINQYMSAGQFEDILFEEYLVK